MLVTEEEAKARWCPFVRASWYVGPQPGFPETTGYLGNRDVNAANGLGVPQAHCIASQCMAFRWKPDAATEQLGLIVDAEDRRFATGAWWDGKYWRTQDDRIHRLIATDAFGGIPGGMFVDHIDGDTNNNRRGNLRIVTKQQNAANAAPRGGKSRYRGVSQSANGKWVAQISSKGVRKCLGTFDQEEEAAKAYDDAAREIHGEFGRLNLEAKSNSGRLGYCGLAGKP